MTVEQLANEFILNYAQERLRPSTIRGYLTNTKKHILPILKDVPINNLTNLHLDAVNENMSQLSNKSKIYVHATFRKMLNYAIRRGYITYNPYSNFDIPRAKKYNYRTLNEEEIKTLLNAVKGNAIQIPIIMALCYGLRRGECLGIRNEDITGNILHIQRSKTRELKTDIITDCKTKDSNRYILLSDKDVKLLNDKALEAFNRFTPSMLDKEFKKILVDNNLPNIRFHDLRHTYATIMLKEGIHPKIVQTVLGHSRISTTLDIYSHPDVSMQKSCLDVWKKKKPP